jgi:HEAT repeat protein
VPELLNTLGDRRNLLVRRAAAEALGKIRDEAVVTQLAEFFQETERDSGKGREICEDVVRILEQIGTSEALEAVEQWRRDRQEKNTS